MKTIKQIADEIGVSKQAVYKRYKGKLHTEVYPYTHTIDGAVYIEEQGETIIKLDFSKNDISYGVHTETHTECIQDTPTDTVTDTTTNLLIQMLQKELEIKNKQIEELTSTVKILSESINADRHNALAETIIDTKSIAAASDEQESENKKRGFWRFWKK